MALIDFFTGKKTFKREPPRGDVRLYNTKTGQKEPVSVLTPPTVRMYNCGPTVYAQAHIGNLRAYVFADILKRTLLQAGFTIDQVINITDVGHLTSDNDEGADKMEEGAKKAGKSAREIAHTYTDLFMKDLSALNILTEDISFPKATDHIGEQIALIQTLVEKGYTYKTSDGIYFDSSLFKTYGSLGGINLTGIKEGARVEKNPEKKHPTDFALWKFSTPEEKRQQEWLSPWGVGFPGWHIECSAMAMKYLGSTLDIHTGGIDHIPVHHNNEIAQSEAATGRTFARFWLHSEHLMIEGRKISKSLGNTITIDQLIDRGISPLAYRYFLLTGHYRSKMNFTWEALEGSAAALFRLRKYFVEQLSKAKKHAEVDKKALTTFTTYMNDDLDTPKAVAFMWEYVKNNTIDPATKRATLSTMDEWLGLGILESDVILSTMHNSTVPTEQDEEIKTLLEKRETARKNKDWKEADRIRTFINAKGFEIIDSPHGQTLEPKK